MATDGTRVYGGTRKRPKVRRLRSRLALVTAAALGASAFALTAPANAAEVDVTGGYVDWGVAGLACPNCGGTQFQAKRSAKGKVVGTVTLGVGGVLAPKSRVRCITCKTEYLRA